MKKTNITENLVTKKRAQIIDDYLKYLRAGRNDKLDESTIKKYRESIWAYWGFIKYKPLKKNFNKQSATDFKQSLQNSIRTNHNTCTCGAEFFSKC